VRVEVLAVTELDDHGTILTSDLAAPEGPLLLADGTWLVTELDVERGTVTQIRADGSRNPIAKTGRPNGLAMTEDGAVWVAESLQPSVIRLELTGEYTRELERVDGVELLWPNDLCVGPDGAIYVTDSGIAVGDFLIDGDPREDCKELPVDGRVLRFDPGSQEASFLDRGLKFANGIGFGPDGLLYVNETYTGDIYRYRLEHGVAVGARELFGNVLDPDYVGDGLQGPDGMAFSADGRLWVAVLGQGDITVLATDGSVERRIKLPGDWPTNVAFGPPGDRRIYIVEDERGSLETRYVGVDGLPLHK
jgi:gluconolactonase